MVKEDCRKLCERNFCLSFERCLLKLIVRFLYIKGVVVGMSLKILIQLCYFLRYITIQHLYVKSWKFNLISLSMCSKKSARDTPITRKKNQFSSFPFALWPDFFFIFSGSTSTITHTKYYTLHKTSFWWCRLLLFSLLVPSATAASSLSTIQHTQKEQL